jgi:uncharacterized protein (DUF58 family)
VSWNPTSTALATAIAGGTMLALGLLTGRPDVATLGVPLAGAVFWGWATRSRGALRADRGPVQRDAEQGTVSAVLDLDTPPAADAVLLRLRAPGYRVTEALLAPGPRSLEMSIETVRTGRADVFGIDAIASGAESMTRSEPVSIPAAEITLLPRTRPLAELPLPFRLQGLTGGHGSPRIGAGGDLRDVNVFTPGDRLRRIDWRVTARRAGSNPGGRISDLYVRRTFAVADATVVLVIDSRDEVGPEVSTWSEWQPPRHDQATSLDIAREAAASIARRYLELGDRVGMADLGRSAVSVTAAGGRRQLHRLTHRLALAEPEGEPIQRLRAPTLPSGALVVLFSTFLDDQAARMARQWRHSGHRVLAVDILPDIDADDLDDVRGVAHDLLRLERNDRLHELVRSGVELVRWVYPAASMRIAALGRAGRRR